MITNSVFAVSDTTKTTEFLNLPDTSQIRLLIELSDVCEVNEIPYYVDKALILGEKIYSKNLESDYIMYYAAAYSNQGFYYDQVGNIKEAIQSNLKALKIREEIKDTLGVAESYNNIASIFQQQEDLASALSYYKKAETLFESQNYSPGLINVYINIGFVHYSQEKYDSAQLYFEDGLNLAKELNDINAMGFALNNLASIYNKNGDYEKTESTYLESLKLREQVGWKSEIARSHQNLGRFYLNQKTVSKSLDHAHISYDLAQELNSPDILGDASVLLSDIYLAQGEFKKAYSYLTIYNEMKDSILSNETQKFTLKQQIKYEYEKQKAIDDKEYEKQLAISAEQEKKQQVIIYFTIGVLGLFILFSVLIANRLRITRKQKLVIEEQKTEVEKQKEIIEVTHKEITDSIAYAKRIQNAILPPDKIVKQHLEKSFVLYKPKDVVAGDFYWIEHKEEKILFAAADCTGHGVPGAMVSVICNNALNRSVREHGLTDPGKILDKTCEIVLEEFEKSDEDVNDGMDIALCSLENDTLNYAGAHNPLWVIRNGKIIETKANKQPIGKFDNQLPFTTHSFKLQKGDSVYIFSDGYIDQFGGPKGKKFKSKAFRQLLLSVQNEKMEKQKDIIDETFENWKGNLEQIDDVCIMGIKI